MQNTPSESPRFCPVCKTSAESFSDRAPTPRTDASCRYCGSLERHRFLWIYLQKHLDFFSAPPEKMLHVAPEKQFVSHFRRLLGEHYVTADLFDPDVDVKMDISNIQYPDDSFPFIYCSHVLEHVDDDIKAISELCRILTPNGTAIILVPVIAPKTIEDPTVTDPKERLRLFGQTDHVRKYGPDFLERLERGGFSVETVTRLNTLSQEEIIRMGITKHAGDIFVCKKRSRHQKVTFELQ